MRRRTFLVMAGAAALSPFPKTRALSSLGTVAWIESGSLWIRELPDGSKLKLASAEGLQTPRFSPSGRWIVMEDREDKRWLVRSDGQAGSALDTHAARLLSREDLPLLHPDGVFAPDRLRYVFSRDQHHDRTSVSELCLASLNAPDRQPEVLVSDQNGAMQPYAWTRDGKSIIYWKGDDWSASLWADGVGLHSVEVESRHSRELGVTALDHGDALDLAPSLAGNKLAVTDGDGRQTWSAKRITLIDLDTGVSRRLMTDDIASIGPSWSPDGRLIACSAAPDADAAYSRVMAGINYPVTLPNGSVETRTITPGSRVGIGGGEEAHVYLQQRKIWLLDPGGGYPPRQLTNDPRYRDEEPMWSADGGHILFGRMDYEGNRSLWLMEANGANPAQMCNLPAGEESWFGYYGYIDWRSCFDWRR